MIAHDRIALNRIAAPRAPLARFLGLAGSLGLDQVELRNDLAGGSVTDELHADEVAQLAAEEGVKVITINALQRFNLAAALPAVKQELEALAATARVLGCPAIVLCPNNDAADRRTPEQMQRETAAALVALRPTLERAGLHGLVEPLGFPESSLRSGRLALEAIDTAGGECFRIVHDTFHHALGQDTSALLEDPAYVSRVGLVHASGVEASIPVEQCRDAHRVLVGPEDRLDSRGQIRALLSAGYAGPISLEPFAPEVQRLEETRLRVAIEESLRYLLAE
jgi:2-keto-myo-inositol isomerase